MPGVRELLPAAARLLSKTHILPAAARTIRYSRTFRGTSCILSSFLSYYMILENFLQNQIRCLVTDFCVTWIYWNHQRVSSEVRNVRTIQGGYGRKDEAAAILSDNLDLRSRRSKLDNNFTYKQQQQQQQQQQKQINFFLTISKTTIPLKNDNNNKALVANNMDWRSWCSEQQSQKQ